MYRMEISSMYQSYGERDNLVHTMMRTVFLTVVKISYPNNALCCSDTDPTYVSMKNWIPIFLRQESNDFYGSMDYSRLDVHFGRIIDNWNKFWMGSGSRLCTERTLFVASMHSRPSGTQNVVNIHRMLSVKLHLRINGRKMRWMSPNRRRRGKRLIQTIANASDGCKNFSHRCWPTARRPTSYVTSWSRNEYIANERSILFSCTESSTKNECVIIFSSALR